MKKNFTFYHHFHFNKLFINKKKTTHKEERPQVELILVDMPQDFVWRKNQYLDLRAKIVNNSRDPIYILLPREQDNVYFDYYNIKFLDGFDPDDCDQLMEIEYTPPSPPKIVTVMPGESKNLYIKGRNYYDLFYCNENHDFDEVKLQLIYAGQKNNFTSDSPFIKENFRTEMSENEKNPLKPC